MWTAERPPCQEAHQGAQACPGPRGQPHPSLHRQRPLRALSSTTQETPTASPSSSREAHPMALWHTSVRNNITHAVIRPCSAVVDAQICLPNTGNSAREVARNVSLSGAAQLLAACLEAPLGVTGTTKPDVPPYRFPPGTSPPQQPAPHHGTSRPTPTCLRRIGCHIQRAHDHHGVPLRAVGVDAARQVPGRAARHFGVENCSQVLQSSQALCRQEVGPLWSDVRWPWSFPANFSTAGDIHQAGAEHC